MYSKPLNQIESVKVHCTQDGLHHNWTLYKCDYNMPKSFWPLEFGHNFWPNEASNRIIVHRGGISYL